MLKRPVPKDAWTTSTLTTLARAAALPGLAGQAVRLEYARELQADRAHHSGEWRRSASALSSSSAFLCAHLIAQNLPLVHPLHEDGDDDAGDASGALALAAAAEGEERGGGGGRGGGASFPTPPTGPALAGPAGSAFRRTSRHYRVDSAGSLRAKRLSWEGKKLPRVPGEPPDSDSASASSSASTSGAEQQRQEQGSTSSAGPSSMRTIAELRNATATTRVATPTPTSPTAALIGGSAAAASPEPVLPPADEPARRRSAVPAPAPASSSVRVRVRPLRAEDAVEMRGGVYTQASVRIGSRRPPFAVKGMGLMAGYDCLCFLPPAAAAAAAAARGKGVQGGGGRERKRAEKGGQKEEEMEEEQEQEEGGRWHPLEHIIFQGRHTVEEARELERMFEWSDLLCIHCKREIVF